MELNSENIRNFILENIEDHPSDVSALVGEEFSISRQAVHLHLKNLEEEGVISSQGSTLGKKYFLRVMLEQHWTIPLSSGLQEDRVWREHIEPLMKQINIKSSVTDMC